MMTETLKKFFELQNIFNEVTAIFNPIQGTTYVLTGLFYYFPYLNALQSHKTKSRNHEREMKIRWF